MTKVGPRTLIARTAYWKVENLLKVPLEEAIMFQERGFNEMKSWKIKGKWLQKSHTTIRKFVATIKEHVPKEPIMEVELENGELILVQKEFKKCCRRFYLKPLLK